VTITGNSVLQLDFSESVSGVSSTSVVIKNNAGVAQTITVAGSGSSYTIDPNPDLVNGNYVLYVGESAITDADGEGATPDRINFTVDDAVTTVTRAAETYLATSSLSPADRALVLADISSAIAVHVGKNSNNLLNVIPDAFGGGATRISTLAPADQTALKQGLLTALVGSANGAASIDGNPGRTVRLNATQEAGFALLDDAVSAKLVTLAVAGSIAASEMDEMVTAYQSGLVSAGADTTQQATLAGTFQSTLTTAVTNSTLSAADQATIVANVSTGGSSVSGVSGTTYTLTTGVDNIVGTGANDTIVATDESHLGSIDSIDGGGGTDTLTIVSNGSATLTPGSLSGVEVVAISDSGGTTFSLLGSTGVTTVRSTGSSSVPTFSNVGADVTTLEIINSGVGATVTFATTAVSGTTDSKNIKLSNMSAGAITMNSVETLNIESTGGTNVITTLTAGAATTVNISGDTAVTYPDNSSVATTITSTNSAGATIYSKKTGAVTVTGGNANDTIIRTGAGADSISGGAGNDSITHNELGTTDTINGGDGTDTLTTESADAIALDDTTKTTYAITNIETLAISDQLTGGSLNLNNIAGQLSRLNLARTGGDILGAATTVTGASGSLTIGLGGSAADNTGVLGQNLTVADNGTSTDDSLTLINSSDNSTGPVLNDVFNGVNVTSDGYENVTINSGAITSTVEQDIGTLTINHETASPSTGLSLTLTGTAPVHIDGNLAVESTHTGLLTINASGLTAQTASGVSTFTLDGITQTGTGATTSITGSAGVDNITASNKATTISGGAGSDGLNGGTAADNITGDAGNDVIVGGGGNDIIAGGDGNDTITVSGTSVNVDGGAGNDSVNMDATLTSGDTVVGGDGTDTLRLDAAATAGGSIGVSGFEVLRLDTAATQDMVLFINNTTFTDVHFNAAGTSSATNSPAGLATVLAANDTILTVSRLLDTSANSLTFQAIDNSSASDNITLTVDNEETLTWSDRSSFATAPAITIDNLSADDLVTLTVSGVSAKTITNAIYGANDTLTTINASGNTGTVSISAGSSTVAMTITGSSTAANTLTSGSGTDAITGGSAADSLTGGTGADTINGAAAADTINGGGGADSLTGGEGTDVIIGGSGNDTIILTETTAAADNVTFESVAITNGTDTITGFDNASDYMDFHQFIVSGFSLNNTYTAAPSQTARDNKSFVLVDIADGADITTAAGLTTALRSGGEYSTLGSASDNLSVIITFASTTSSTGNIFYVTDDAGSGSPTATAVGTVDLGSGKYTSLTDANFKP
jgi:hypothetical protein